MSTVRLSTNPIAVSAAVQSDYETRGSHVEWSWDEDTGNRKKRRHSIRVYCRQFGKQDNPRAIMGFYRPLVLPSLTGLYSAINRPSAHSS